MYELKYHRPETVRQAANLLAKNEDAKVIAGGHTLVPVMKQRLASPPHLVDISHVEGLDAIEVFRPDHGPDEERRFLSLARHLRLATTAGSDFHGTPEGRKRPGAVTGNARMLDALRQCKPVRR